MDCSRIAIDFQANSNRNSGEKRIQWMHAKQNESAQSQYWPEWTSEGRMGVRRKIT